MILPEFYRRADGPVFSFEVFPPKDDKGMARLTKVLPKLAKLGPDFMTVTYGAMGTTQSRTLEIASLIQREQNMDAACHLTCVGASRAELDEIITTIHAEGLRNIVALRGDPPEGETEFTPPEDGLAHGNELVAHIRDLESRRGWEPFGIAVAGYPETHVESPDAASDMVNLKRKVDAGADAVVTQLFYNNEDFFRFSDDARRAGIEVPIVAGLLPIVSAKQARRIVGMCGASIPDDVSAKLDACDGDAKAEQAVGTQHCLEQARELVERDVAGIHFYVLNRSAHMAQIMDGLRA
jgi:methylenetetrahydrofolate reductase (NADPH)